MRLIPPTTLKQHGIRFSRVVQYPNEFIATFSGGYHCGFNGDFNEAEAINFGTERWLNMFPKYQPCDCQDRRGNYLKIKENLSEVYRLLNRKNPHFNVTFVNQHFYTKIP